MHSDKLRRFAVLTMTIVAITITYGQLFGGWGQSQAQLSASGDSTLKVAGYAFSIWGVIFTGILIYAFYQLKPSTPDSRLNRELGWSMCSALTGLSLWIVASAMDWKIATVALIFVQLLSLLVPLWHLSPEIRKLATWDLERTLIVWPICLLAGWLTIASPLNLVTVVTALGVLPTILSPTSWAVITIVSVTTATLIVTARLGTLAYCIPVAWGLIGAYVAEQSRNPQLAYICIAAALAVAVGSLLLTLRDMKITSRHRLSASL